MAKVKELDKLLSLHNELKRQPNGRIGDANSYFSGLQLLPSQFAYLIDIVNGKIAAYKGFDSCLGYQTDDVTLRFLYTLFHPDEEEMMREIVSRAWKSLLSSQVKPFELDFALDYRVRKADGEYIRVLRQSTNLETDLDGISTVTFSLCTDITAVKNSGPVSYRWKSSIEGSLKVEDLLKSESIKLSKREIEILKLLSKGFSSEMIADKLSISQHTVSTHRKNMLKKSNSNSMVELIIYAINNKFI